MTRYTEPKHHRIAYSTKFYLQIYSEFNRIFDKEMIQVIREIWEETKPKIIEVAKNEQGSALKLLYEESTSCASEGIRI